MSKLTKNQAKEIASLMNSLLVSEMMLKDMDFSDPAFYPFELAGNLATHKLAVDHGIVLPNASTAAVYVEAYEATDSFAAANTAVIKFITAAE